MGSRVVEEQGQSLKMRGIVACLDLLEIGSPTPDLSHCYSPIEFNPGSGARQRMDEPFDVCLPGTKVEIKIVLTVAKGVRQGPSWGWSRLGKCHRLICDSAKGE